MMTRRLRILALFSMSVLLATGVVNTSPARSADEPATAEAPERARGRIKKEEASQLMKRLDVAMRARDSRGLADLLAAKFNSHIVIEGDDSASELVEKSRAAYIEALKARWSAATEYVYDRRNESFGAYPSGKVALVRSDIAEQFETEGAKERTVTHTTATLEVVGSRLLITKLTGFAKHTPPLY